MISNNILFKNLSKELFEKKIRHDGFIVVEDVIQPHLIESTKKQLADCIEKEALNFQNNNKNYGMLICCPIYGGDFLKIIEQNQMMLPFDWILGETSIIYVYTSSSLPPYQKNYASRIHVDRPHDTGNFIESLGCLVLLDDFTAENGGTWVLPQSHLKNEEPEEEYFYSNAIRIVAPKGSVFYFHLRLWHAGGHNHSSNWRHSLGIGMVRAYMKQRIDIPRAMQHLDLSNISEYGLQKLGFYSQPPTSLEEYHQPKEKRSYKQKSEWEIKK